MLVEHRKVCRFTHLDAAGLCIQAHAFGAVDGVDLQRFAEGQALLRSQHTGHLAGGVAAGDQTFNANPWVGRLLARWPVGPTGHQGTGFDQALDGVAVDGALVPHDHFKQRDKGMGKPQHGRDVGHHVELGKTGHVLRGHKGNVCNLVAWAVGAVNSAHFFNRVQRLAHGTVSHRVELDGHALLVQRSQGGD